MTVPPYPTDELKSRVVDGSIDQTRLAASVLELQTAMAAIVNWINQQQTQQQERQRQQRQQQEEQQERRDQEARQDLSEFTPEAGSSGVVSGRGKGAGSGNAKG